MVRGRPPAAAAINGAARVVAVGTTVVRALESAAGTARRVLPGQGWTHLAITPERRLRAVDALLTGLHEPGASHLDIVAAAVPRPLLERAHAEMLERGYLWHEFGELDARPLSPPPGPQLSGWFVAPGGFTAGRRTWSPSATPD